MTIYSDACGRVIDITLEYQTKPLLLEMQEKLVESEEENTEEESKKSAQAEASQIPVEIESQQTTFRVSFSLVV